MNRRVDHKSPLTHSNWYILGPGAIGTLWASRFLTHNIPVSLICRTQQSAHSLSQGFTLENQQSSTRFSPHCVTSDHLSQPCEHVLITCKAHQTMDALHSIGQFIRPTTHLVLLQNGIGVASQIHTQYPDNPLILGITNDAAYRKTNNHIHHVATGDTWFGAWETPRDNASNGSNNNPNNNLQKTSTSADHSPTPHPTIDSLRTIGGRLAELSPKGQWDGNIMRRVWQKFAINCAINGLTVLYQCKNGQLLDQGPKQQHLQRICTEIDQIIAANDQALEPPIYESAVNIAKQTALNYSSMLQDSKNNKALEIDYLNGYLCTIADQKNLACEENRALTQQLNRRAK
ncbi:MAG: hypothetical protein COB04_13090 [Gammaproteobacteria bacterium]|nr:MAG: hypothetical protein COB04_13090 [Gammaproteobacteria bacterium]